MIATIASQISRFANDEENFLTHCAKKFSPNLAPPFDSTIHYVTYTNDIRIL